MNRDEFVERHEPTWRRVEEILDLAEKNAKHAHGMADLPELYRRCCHHLALARQRHYDAALESRLNRIALRGYHQLYRQRFGTASRMVSKALRFVAADFPALLRAHAAMFWLATVLFYGPGIAMGLWVLDDPDAVYALLSPEQVAMMEDMYRVGIDEDRGAEADFGMFGYYIQHNIGIAFRTFAGGIFAGLGTIFYLTFNGLYLGAIFAHLTSVGSGGNLLTFVITHGAFELTALVIAGVAGLRLGSAVVSPGRHSRSVALRLAATDALRLALGAGVMLLAAAFLEAFWSASGFVPPWVKQAVGAATWVFVVLYLFLGGRRTDGRGAGGGRLGGAAAT